MMSDQKSRWKKIGDQLRTSWHQMRDRVAKQWDELTEDDLHEVEGQIERLADKISERYGVARDEAMSQIDKWAEQEVPYLGGTVKDSPATRWTVVLLVIAAFLGLIAFTPFTALIEGLAGALFWVALVGAGLLIAWRLIRKK